MPLFLESNRNMGLKNAVRLKIIAPDPPEYMQTEDVREKHPALRTVVLCIARNSAIVRVDLHDSHQQRVPMHVHAKERAITSALVHTSVVQAWLRDCVRLEHYTTANFDTHHAAES